MVFAAFRRCGKAALAKGVPIPEAAWAVNIPLDRQLVVAALGDGTVRWYRLQDGAEVLALFIHPDGRRWITWTPQGYYDASAGADELIGWHVNNGWDRAPDFLLGRTFSRSLLSPRCDRARARHVGHQRSAASRRYRVWAGRHT